MTYSNTRGTSAVDTLRKRVCLCAPPVTVCAVVCVQLMTCVLHTGYSDELWRFNMFTHGWERVDSTSDNGDLPRENSQHAMASVGLDLWVSGGFSGEGDTCAIHEARLRLPH